MIEIVHGDCRSKLKEMSTESVNCCVTSPPYFGLRDYNVDGQIGLEHLPKDYVKELVDVFREVRRVLKNDGTLWLVMGDSWASTAQGTFNAPQKIAGSNANVYANFRPKVGLPPKNMIGIPWRVAFALQEDGWILRQDIIWQKTNPAPESVKDRCTKSHEYIFLLSKSQKYYFDDEAIKEDAAPTLDYEGNPKPTKKNKRDVWSVPTKPYKGAHFATFPPELIEPCILAGCPESGTVLDPFGGSGTTGLVAKKLNRNAVLIELNKDYCEMSEHRVEM